MMRWMIVVLLAVCAGCQYDARSNEQRALAAPLPAVAESADEARPIGEGRPAPTAEMQTVDGETVSIESFYTQKPTVLVFYRGGWCPYCSTHLSELGQIQDNIRQMGFQIVAVSMDKPSKLRTTLDKSELGYTLLSDADAQLTRAFGLAFRVSQPTLKRYEEFGIDLQDASGHDHHILPVPAVYLIDQTGMIQFAHWNPDYKTRLNGEKILQAARDFKRANQ